MSKSQKGVFRNMARYLSHGSTKARIARSAAQHSSTSDEKEQEQGQEKKQGQEQGQGQGQGQGLSDEQAKEMDSLQSNLLKAARSYVDSLQLAGQVNGDALAKAKVRARSQHYFLP